MKKLFLVALLILATVFGCQFSENIYINEDGSGKMEFTFDASEIMQMAGDEMNAKEEKPIDSMIVFKDFLEEKKDSIATLPEEEQKKLEALKDFTMHMVMNPETKEMKFNLSTDFKNASDLQDMFAALNSMSNMQGENGVGAGDANNPFAGYGADGNSEVSYAYANNVFERKAVIKNKELLNQASDSLDQMGMMFGSSKYKLNYHFPRKVKSVSNENALLSQDGKTVTIEYSFMDFIKDPEQLNLKVELED